MRLPLGLAPAPDVVDQGTQVVTKIEVVGVSTAPEAGGEEMSTVPQMDGVGVSAVPQLVEGEGLSSVPQHSCVRDAIPAPLMWGTYSKGVAYTHLRDRHWGIVMFNLGNINPEGGANVEV